MGGLARILKLYGTILIKNDKGEEIVWVWDYANDKPRLKTEMTEEEMTASEKAKWETLKTQLTNQKNQNNGTQ